MPFYPTAIVADELISVVTDPSPRRGVVVPGLIVLQLFVGISFATGEAKRVIRCEGDFIAMGIPCREVLKRIDVIEEILDGTFPGIFLWFPGNVLIEREVVWGFVGHDCSLGWFQEYD